MSHDYSNFLKKSTAFKRKYEGRKFWVVTRGEPKLGSICNILTKVQHISRPKACDIMRLEELGKPEILIPYLRSGIG